MLDQERVRESGVELSELLEQVAAIGPTMAAHAARHDAEGSFVAEGVRLAREAGLLGIAVPVELGGRGATVGQVAAVQRALARYCGSTALATAMHQHVVCFAAWGYRHGERRAEATLRRVARDGIVLVTTGGGDFTRPSGTAMRVDGGYRVSGRKRFVSLSSAGDVLSTLFPTGDHGDRRVLSMAIPIDAAGVTVLDNWDALGMRGTASHDVCLEDVFVADDAVLADRPYGIIDPPLQVVIAIAVPIISAVYLGVAEAAYRAAIDAATTHATDPLIQYKLGRMAHRLRIADWALDGALSVAGHDPQPSMDTVAAVGVAKLEIARAGAEVCDLAMEIAGGTSFFKGSIIERCYRDIRAAKFHPFTPDRTLLHAGRVALGVPADQW